MHVTVKLEGGSKDGSQWLFPDGLADWPPPSKLWGGEFSPELTLDVYLLVGYANGPERQCLYKRRELLDEIEHGPALRRVIQL